MMIFVQRVKWMWVDTKSEEQKDDYRRRSGRNDGGIDANAPSMSS